MAALLLFSVFIIATCGLIYELIAGALASYLLGDSITQFSTVIGAYLFSMGVGSFFSKYIDKNLLFFFINIEILVGLIGGSSAAFLFLLFEHVASFRVLLYTFVGLTGILVGLEIPLLMRILQNRFEFKDLVSRVFAVDYVGALLASLLFPLVLVPYLGLMRSAFLFGILNVSVAAGTLYFFRKEVRQKKILWVQIIIVSIALLIGFVQSNQLLSFAETEAYEGDILYATTTLYQRIVLARNDAELRLYLNGNLQFSSSDEYRYHEALVHPTLAAHTNPKSILILGGGDGLAAREVLKYPSVQKITLVDLDPAMTRLFSQHPILTQLNSSALSSAKLQIVHADAFLWLKNTKAKYDCVIIDFPDPSNFSLGKLYTLHFYRQLQTILNPDGIVVVQSTSPYVARQSYWCIAQTMQAAGFRVIPYHCFVPSFGEWGYTIGTLSKSFQSPMMFPPNLRFITHSVFQNMQIFPPDMSNLNVEVNQLNNQILVHYFEKEWKKYNRHN